MSLPTPNLDDRSFQDFVDEVKRRIGYRCPEWTEHNVSDPGVTLVELFAGMAETILYRLNQVPEKNFIKFMELLGISLGPPHAANTDLRFRLTSPLKVGTEHAELTLHALQVSAATTRTDVNEAVEFVLTDTLKLIAPVLEHIFSVPNSNRSLLSEKSGAISTYDLKEYSTEISEISDRQALEIARQNAIQSQAGNEVVTEIDQQLHALDDKLSKRFFPIFSGLPAQDDAVYFGFATDISGHLIELRLDGLSIGADRLREGMPLHVWEFFEPRKEVWIRINPLSDLLRGFNCPGGTIELPIPYGLRPCAVNGQEAYYIRCRYTTRKEDLPKYIGQEHLIDAYTSSPKIRAVSALALGGDARAENSEPIFDEVLGVSDGLPGQMFKVSFEPTLELDKAERLLRVYEPSDDGDSTAYSVWTSSRSSDEPRTDFSESEADDQHFIFDPLTGFVSFGPAIRCPDGSVRQCGAIPPKGHKIAIPRYRIGGGTRGNVREDSVRILKSNDVGIASVTNIRAAENGKDRETLLHAQLRLAQLLRTRNRAVTAEDFEVLSIEGSKENDRPRVARATCVPSSSKDKPGTICVLLVPSILAENLNPLPEHLRVDKDVVAAVSDYLEDRKLLTTCLSIEQPRYVYVSTDIELVAEPHADPEAVGREVQARLSQFVHPTFGGFDKKGWPFKQRLTISDLYAVISSTPGVAYHMRSPRVLTSIESTVDGSRTAPKEVDLKDGIPLDDDQLFVSREHRVKVLHMWEAGRD